MGMVWGSCFQGVGGNSLGSIPINASVVSCLKFPEILSIKLFGSSFGNSYIASLVVKAKFGKTLKSLKIL